MGTRCQKQGARRNFRHSNPNSPTAASACSDVAKSGHRSANTTGLINRRPRDDQCASRATDQSRQRASLVRTSTDTQVSTKITCACNVQLAGARPSSRSRDRSRLSRSPAASTSMHRWAARMAARMAASSDQLAELRKRRGTWLVDFALLDVDRNDPHRASTTMLNSTASPGATLRCSRIAFGSVTCDLVVRVQPMRASGSTRVSFEIPAAAAYRVEALSSASTNTLATSNPLC